MAASRILSSLLFVASLAGVHAQSTTPYTDATTGIDFQQFTSDKGFSFGIALSEESNTDFIGQISASITGWAGVTLTGSMRNALLVVVYPNGDNVVSSLRTTTGYSNPGIFSGDATIKPIEAGVSANETGFTYTFLCEGCILPEEKLSFDPTAESGVLGWALSTTAVATPSSASSALEYHDGGFGGFGLNIAGAKSAKFAEWAAMASSGNTTIPSPPSGGNGTTPIPGNTTVPVSNLTYDYIVVGGGASGLVVSQRLAETGKSVLVLERGGPSFHSSGGGLLVPWNNNTLTAYEVPGLFMALPTIPGNNAYCSDVPEQAGCILGGGTAVNGLQFVRPPSFDFDDNWPAGWKWAEVQASAERVYERNPGSTSPSMDGKYYDNAPYDVLSQFFASAGWKQVDTNDEPDEKFQIYSYPAINTINGLRAGPVRTYLPLAMGLPNFKLQMHTKVIRAVRTGSAITGVEVEQNGQRMIINVNTGGKVILAAGAMSSPRILFNSGIGPSEQINIVKSGTTGVTLPPEESWINLPVGFVRDHAYIQMSFNVKGNMTILGPDAFTNPSNETLSLYSQGSGPLAQSFNRIMTYTTVTNDDGHKTLIQTHGSSSKNNTVTLLFAVTHDVTSTGTLGITPNGNTEWTVNPHLNSASDKEAMAKAIDEVLAITRQSNSTLTYIGSANATGTSIVAENKPLAGVHMTGTTIMGTDDGTKNGSSVVDLNCKVYGTDNLYVVDAGMHPDLPTGNTQAIVMVAAEHAVQKIIAGGNSTANVTATAPVGVVSGSSTLTPFASATATRTPYRGRPVRGGGRGKGWWQL